MLNVMKCKRMRQIWLSYCRDSLSESLDQSQTLVEPIADFSRT
jgi:hypothetical protein